MYKITIDKLEPNKEDEYPKYIPEMIYSQVVPEMDIAKIVRVVNDVYMPKLSPPVTIKEARNG